MIVPEAARPQALADLAACADERVKTAMLQPAQLSAAEAACSRVLSGNASTADQQKASFYRGLMRFLQVVQRGAAAAAKTDGSVAYAPPTLAQVRPALVDIEAAIGLDGPMKGDALALRATINQTIGRSAEARADVAEAMQAAPKDATPFVQRALEHERDGDVNAAMIDLDRALELDPKAGTALSARGDLLRRLGYLQRARIDLEGAAALGPPFRRLALMRKSELELRAGDLRAAYEDIVAASRETGDLPKADAALASADLFVQAGALALDKLKDTETAEKLYREAEKLAPKNWSAALGLARVAEVKGERAKAEAIYKRILAATRATPKLLERILASWRLKQLSQPAFRGTGPFRSGFDSGVVPAKPSPDGLKRIAFVIGSSDYAELSSLPNARRDAAVMANALADMGFDAIEIAENVGKADLRRIPALIAEQAAQADVVLVFYAGHGVETGGVNYLVPTDATLDSDKALQSDALALRALAAAAAKARRGALVIVDACRDDPFAEAQAVAASRGSAGRQLAALPARIHGGLAAAPQPAPNNVVLHSTQPGKTASDGDGLDSPFVRALLETLSSPGKTLDAVVQETAARVSEKTEGRQVPAAYGAAPSVALLPKKAAR
ncbi:MULTISPECIES: caspase family protein [Bosea]|uniref:caspase family protein n=1 Tax=Bosea TaxID=85413 RepID=UPI00214F7680|nr:MULTISPECIES: caspase family protein [Bosea]MCR4521596.1 caspase family protein [Bosea sp. 47.2.35]MDR6829341.1 tetratricopeptide (TPR) repeat protein [Bosea robiniae]MDR6896144.1 tetratricopeptide (TPR) repeat protein [Bosea sp. BE109]MDR7139622.1 tetratricopeptide (TPR) repeat protein [Bosea sp. BE168]MDR7176239.1 tetratricopeptide (TPR) repeat protein [Bosea sp. BE271]